jgi:hypothetical protein
LNYGLGCRVLDCLLAVGNCLTQVCVYVLSTIFRFYGSIANKHCRFYYFSAQVTIEFKPLLSRGCLTGDFPILVNSRAIGGVLRVCLRTRPVLDPDRYEGLPWDPSDGAPVSLSISAYKKGLSFAFPNETNSKNNDSIESIKRESASSSVITQGTN